MVVEGVPSQTSRRERLLVLYASQTGTAMGAAEHVEREAERRGCTSAVVLSVDSYDVHCLAYEEIVIFIVATTGQGEMPDSMKVFWKFLLQRSLGSNWLNGVSYAVFGLGDSSYQKYNFAAKKLEKRLFDIGGTPIVERGLGDDQHLSGYEASFDPWLSTLWRSVHQLRPLMLPSVDLLQPQMTLNSPKFEVTYFSIDSVEKVLPNGKDMWMVLREIEKSRSMSAGLFNHMDYRPHHLLQMTKNEPLTKSGVEKDVRHLEFGSATSKIEYQLGDTLEVLPSQNPSAVDAFIHRCNLEPDSYITVRKRKLGNDSSEISTVSTMDAIKLKTFVELTMDVASASPQRYFFEVMSFFATAEHEKEKLQYFSSPEGRDDLYQYNQRERRTVLEVLEDFPSVQLPFEWLVQLVPPLKTRAFSIASSPRVHPNEVHLTVGAVSWKTPLKRNRQGLCSTWLASLHPQENGGAFIPAWIHRSSFPPPAPTSPLILVGPGTGCAPFHAFIQERAKQNLEGMTTGSILFFFGCRNKEGDFLYEDFWLAHSDSGVLSSQQGGGFFAAFSRDQPSKIYVQHKMREERTRIWELLSAGASIYVAGSSNKMPADVTDAFEEIISEEGRTSKESASRWLKQQERAGRFFIEAW